MKMIEKKYCQIVDKEKGIINIGLGTNTEFYKSIGMTEEEVEKCEWNNQYYLKGKCPPEPEKTYQEKRRLEYPKIENQLDMLYWDKVNGTNKWYETIKEIKEKYPKT